MIVVVVIVAAAAEGGDAIIPIVVVEGSFILVVVVAVVLLLGLPALLLDRHCTTLPVGFVVLEAASMEGEAARIFRVYCAANPSGIAVPMHVLKIACRPVHKQHGPAVETFFFAATIDKRQVAGLEDGVVVKGKVPLVGGRVNHHILLLRLAVPVSLLVVAVVRVLGMVVLSVIQFLVRARDLELEAIREDEVSVQVVVPRLLN